VAASRASAWCVRYDARRDACCITVPFEDVSSENCDVAQTGDENTRINIERRVRPLRFGFVVDPKDVATVRRAFEINTFLWGGRLNSLIPLYSEAPAGWPPPSAGRKRLSPLAAARGFVNAFEPDYLVEMRDGLSGGLEFSADFIVKQKDLHYDDDRLGLTVLQVFEHEHNRTFQFVQKHPWEAAFRAFDGMELLSAATFGCYGEDGAAPKRHFEQAFAPAPEVIDETTYWRTLQGEPKLNPLRAGLFQLQIPYYVPYTLFFCDPESVHDVLDFWNLRALGWLIVPLPQQWARPDEVMKIVERHRGPRGGTRVLKSFSSSEARWRTLTSRMAKGDGLSIERRMPQIWAPRQKQSDGTSRLDVWCMEDEIEVMATEGSLQIPVAAPAFFKGNRYGWTVHWANDLRLSNYSDSDRAAAFPFFQDVGRVLSRWERPTIKQSSDGLVIYARHAFEKKYVQLPRNFEVIHAWMEDRGHDVELSGAGRIASELVRTLGGIRSISLIKSVALVEFVNSLSHTGIETEGSGGDKRVRVGTVSRQRLIQILRQYTDGWGRQNSDKAAEVHMRELLARSVFRVGIKLQCQRCTQHNWYAIDDLAETLRCERCLQTYAFPASSPTDARWEYRPIGPFATENYAQGAYAAVLAIHFLLAENVNRSVWCPGFEIKRQGQKTIECDFAIFIPRRLAFNDMDFAAGEAKCGARRFQEKDYATCRSFVSAFPGAAFIFATTRTALDADEQRAIRTLVRKTATRKSAPGNPIIVLTRAELEAGDAPARSWPEDLTEEYRNDYVSSQLQRLARATQRLYLK